MSPYERYLERSLMADLTRFLQFLFQFISPEEETKQIKIEAEMA